MFEASRKKVQKTGPGPAWTRIKEEGDYYWRAASSGHCDKTTATLLENRVRDYGDFETAWQAFFRARQINGSYLPAWAESWAGLMIEGVSGAR
ncbi:MULTISPECIES: hypothetical protein [Uliginosibacterium]|uniref:Uncharacterized protein n=1 Tax=Uliginosibacterium aquaticum TaxID=2731212 RepID=A0ABX2IMR9_9RHOO|nr:MULTISPECIES: hypothetical protein [Uliginosibacterium]MDO6384958.1 hypothetical protein [Uliginosibacterium sp. 31-12]NSL55330.1 hypothetical protein [Uliginosibacterium aquaticum]